MARFVAYFPLISLLTVASLFGVTPWLTYADSPPLESSDEIAVDHPGFAKLGTELQRAVLETPFSPQRAIIVLNPSSNLPAKLALTAFRLSKSAKTASDLRLDRAQEKIDNQLRLEALRQTQEWLVPELQTLGVRTVHRLPYLNAMAVEGPAHALVQAANAPEIRGIFLPQKLNAAWEESAEAIDWARFQGVDVNPEQPLRHSGSGVVVAVLDTGIDFTKGPFYCEESNEFGKPTGTCAVLDVTETAPTDGQLDNLLHGTSTAGIVHEMVPQATIIGYDIFDSKSVRDFSPEIALNDVLRRKNEESLNVAVVLLAASNESGFHEGYCEDQTLPALIDETLFDAGITVVTPSGNDDDEFHLSYPACARRSISVGAVYDFKGPAFGYFSGHTDNNFDVGDVAGFSNASNMLDLWAPGAVVVTDPDIMRAGTSQAAAFVAGAMAAYLGSDDGPWTDATALVSFLRMSGLPVEDDRTLGNTEDDTDGDTEIFARRQSRLWLLDWDDGPWTEFEHFDSPDGLAIPGDEPLAIDIPVQPADETRKIQQLLFELELSHPDPSGLSITLQSPSGTEVELSSLVGEGSHIKTTYGLHVAADLSLYNGETWAAGTWTLTLDATAATPPSEENPNRFFSSAFLVQTVPVAEYVPTHCGNGLCQTAENHWSCPSDCPDDDGYCGDGLCSVTETCYDCQRDCPDCNQPQDTCEGAVELSTEPGVRQVVDWTLRASNDYAWSCGSNAPDLAYRFEIEEPTTIEAVLDGYNANLYLMAGSCPGEGLVCGNAEYEGHASGFASQFLDPADEQTYYLIVDGREESDSGSFVMEITFAHPCGNEVCDNGETFQNCPADCLYEACGSTCNDFNPCTKDVCTVDGCIYPAVDGSPSCDDENPCTSNDVCQAGSCEGTPMTGTECDDGDPCTSSDACNAGECMGDAMPENAECDDGDPCTTQTKCYSGMCVGQVTPSGSSAPPCDSDEDCEDDEYCKTTDGDKYCEKACDDENVCTYRETCRLGICAAGEAAPGNPSCSDDDPCTLNDTCNGGVCISGTRWTCNDNNPCNGTESCNKNSPLADENGCVAGTPVSCNDGKRCTIDSCDTRYGCQHVPDDSICDDGIYSNGVETCNASSGCQSNSPPVLSDGFACTYDFRVETPDTTQQVQHIPNDTYCTDYDGEFCNGFEFCNPDEDGHDVLGCISGPSPQLDDGFVCTYDSCQETAQRIKHEPDSRSCDDGLFCNGSEICDPDAEEADEEGCTAGLPLDLSDAWDCTDDNCIEQNRQIVHTNNDENCSDGVFCDGPEICNPLSEFADAAGCIPYDGEFLDDGLSCTEDSCDEENDLLVHIPYDPDVCNDDNACNGSELCDPSYPESEDFVEENYNYETGCILNIDPPDDIDDGIECTVDICVRSEESETGYTIRRIADHAFCNNGEFCDGSEYCDLELDCQLGEVPQVDDGFACTDDVCDEVNNRVINTPRNSFCDNRNHCDGTETCDPGNANAGADGCVAGRAPVEDDGIACTDDSCYPEAPYFRHNPIDAWCDDDLFCNGEEICEPDSADADGRGCVKYINVPVVTDQIYCTIDSCDEEIDSVVHEPDNSRCSDGFWCTGIDTCKADSGCFHEPAPEVDDHIACTIDECSEELESVIHTPDDEYCRDDDPCVLDYYCDSDEGCIVATKGNGEPCDEPDLLGNKICHNGTCVYASAGNLCDSPSTIIFDEMNQTFQKDSHLCSNTNNMEVSNPCARDDTVGNDVFYRLPLESGYCYSVRLLVDSANDLALYAIHTDCEPECIEPYHSDGVLNSTESFRIQGPYDVDSYLLVIDSKSSTNCSRRELGGYVLTVIREECEIEEEEVEADGDEDEIEWMEEDWEDDDLNDEEIEEEDFDAFENEELDNEELAEETDTITEEDSDLDSDAETHSEYDTPVIGESEEWTPPEADQDEPPSGSGGGCRSADMPSTAGWVIFLALLAGLLRRKPRTR